MEEELPNDTNTQVESKPNTNDSLSEKILSKIEPGGSLLSEIVGALIASKVPTENLTECIRELERQELVKLDYNYRVSPGSNKDAVRGCSFQILVQKIVTNPDGTKTVESGKRITKKFKRRSTRRK